METGQRYEIVDTIATGEFATVYRARDRELVREVAVKQIHPNFLADPRQLSRYWQEAQLLASLQHPNILTVYDIVRSRGWLVLELMRGSLKPAAEGRPLDLDFLRIVLANCLTGLHFLHANGVIHGDMKPSNILIGPQRQVKLGDFGLARRAANEEGSLLKGTTKYMAPELLSPQFGAVGPASDLYSLGFTAYELLCGDQFESLLPTLTTFGRNKQMAWMMWHSTADVQLPQISRTLAGVPDDLAHVIERLTIKDQSRRYHSAAEVLADLRTNRGAVEPIPVAADPAAEMAALAAARRKRRIRALAALVASLALVILMIVAWPAKKERKAPTGPVGPVHGVVMNIWPDEQKFAIRRDEDGVAAPYQINRTDQIFINGESRLLRDLEPDDPVVIKATVDRRTGRKVQEIRVVRPRVDRGRIVSTDESSLVLDVGTDGKRATLSVTVPADVKILLNGNAEIAGKPVRLKDLAKGDMVTVHHVGEDTASTARDLAAERIVQTAGVLADGFDARSGLLSIVTGAGDSQKIVKLPLAPQYVITINGQPILKPASLKKDDRVTVRHDSHIVEIKADRTMDASGTIEHVHYEPPQTLAVQGENGQKSSYLVGPACSITLGSESVALDDLRPGDTVRIAHGALDPKNQDAIQATSILAQRPSDPKRWAILVATQDYEDKSLTPLNFAVADAKLLADTLVKRYRVPAEQALLLTDESLVRLEQTIPDHLKQIGADGQLIVFVVGHAYKDDQGQIYVAPKNYDARHPAITGLPLQTLVDQLEACPAKEKLLLVDLSHAGQGADLAAEPSTSEMVHMLKPQPNRALFKSVTAVTSCTADQRGLDWPSKNHGLFAECLADAYSGLADTSHDLHLEPTELFGYLQKAMARAAGDLQLAQTPELFLPDDRPPRLTEDAKKSIRRLATLLARSKLDVDAAGHEYAVANRLAGKELEPRLMYGLLLLKAKDRDAMRHFEELRSDQPDLLLPRQALVWLRFDKRAYSAGIGELADLVAKLPKPKKPGEPYPPDAKQIFYWAGQLREFVGSAAQDTGRPVLESLDKLDAALGAHSGEAAELYQQGREHSSAIAADFDKRSAAAEDEASEKLIKLQRHLLANYCQFPFERCAQQVLASLND